MAKKKKEEGTITELVEQQAEDVKQSMEWCYKFAVLDVDMGKKLPEKEREAAIKKRTKELFAIHGK